MVNAHRGRHSSAPPADPRRRAGLTRAAAFAAAAVALWPGAGVCRADVRLPAIFGDNMVLQRDAQVAVWGWSKPGETVRV